MTAELAPIGGVACLLIGIAVAASVAMILPISTPPNALAHGTGMIEQKYMAKSGLIMGIIGLVLGYTMLVLLGSVGFFGSSESFIIRKSPEEFPMASSGDFF